jgi:hypothetical protein
MQQLKCRIRAAAATSRLPAVFAQLRLRFSCFPPREIQDTAALPRLPARYCGCNFANLAQWSDPADRPIKTQAC